MSRTLPLCLVLIALGSVSAQEVPPPIVEGVPLPPLRDNAARLLLACDTLNVALPPVAVKALRQWHPASEKQTEDAVEKLQQILDPHVLVRINVNPESRVKVAAGPANPLLTLDRDVYYLVKIHNEAGVTHALTASGQHLREKGKPAARRWLDGAVLNTDPMPKTLGGHLVEYVLLRLTAREAGKREATLAFDVGQGTQDLGFRNEVPILFTVK